jgi:transposase
MFLLSWLLPKTLRLVTTAESVQEDTLQVTVASTQSAVSCPDCGTPSSHVHGHYVRWPTDLPWGGLAIRLQVPVRRFSCRNKACPRQTFGERFPTVLEPHQRQTRRLQQALRAIGYALGGEAGARLAGTLGMAISSDTILRQLRRLVPAPLSSPRVLGIDDFAFKRGQRYGTLLVDLERRQPVDLLPDRQAETVAAWLSGHPGIEIISRDRAGAYAEGARLGAPQAVQVADRWHLLKNVREALERLLTRYHPAIRQAAMSVATTLGERPVGTSEAAPLRADPAVTPVPLTRRQGEQAARRERRLARYQEVMRLHQEGLPVRAIAQRLGMHRRTVRLFIRAGGFPERATPPGRPSQLDGYRGYLRQRWEAGCHNATGLWRELRAQGFQGCRTLVNRAIQPWRRPRPDQSPRASKSPAPPTSRSLAIPSPRQVSGWLLELAKAADEDTQAYQQAFVERLCEENPPIKTAQELACEFVRLIKERQALRFPGWLEQALHSGVSELEGLARGLQHDQAAVRAALTEPWSNGQVEGQINRLKCLKRQMYGRASFDLLRLRVLRAA